MHASMVLTRSREGHQGPWHAVLHAIAQGIACPCAVCMMIPRDHGMLFCMWCHDVASSRIPPSSFSPPGSSIQSLACKVFRYGLSICVPAVLTRHRLSDPLLHPSAPRRGVESLLRQRVARHAATHHAAGRQTQGIVTHTSITPFPYQTAASRVRHAKSGAMACRFVCLLASHTSPPLRHTQALLVQGSKTSSSARHAATHHAAGRQTQVFLAQTPITPLPYHARASRVWHPKCSAMAGPFACLLFKLVTASHTHCSTQALLTQGSNGFCISASCGHPSCSRSSDTRLPHAHLHHPSSPPGSSIQSLACKI